MTAEDNANIQAMAEKVHQRALIDQIKGISTVIEELGYDESFELLAELDNLGFTCQVCNWYCSIDELAESEVLDFICDGCEE